MLSTGNLRLRAGSYTNLVAAGSLACAGLACNTLDAPTATPTGPRTVRVIPVDDRPVESAEVAPPPVSGGNLLHLQGARNYLATDPARDRISVVTGEDVKSFALPRGSQPERATLDAAGVAHIVLRGTGSIIAFDTTTGSVLATHKVCSAPRGITYDKAQDRLLVACAEGRLLFHSASATDYVTTETVNVETDVRDVIAQGNSIYLTRFRSAEILRLNQSGSTVVKFTPPNIIGSFDGRELAPAVAWRMVEDPSGDGVLVLHQRAVTDALAISPAAESEDGASGDVPQLPGAGGSSPYGGGFAGSCTTIVQTAVTRLSSGGQVSTSASLDGSVLSVDLAVQRDEFGTLQYAVSAAGVKDPELPAISFKTVGNDSNDPGSAAVGFGPAFARGPGGIGQLNLTEVPLGTEGPLSVGCEMAATLPDSPSTSVLLDGNITVFAQPEQAVLRRLDALAGGDFQPIELGGEPITDTGHAIFHRDSGNGIACASCHPEGTDDGRVWLFDEIGARRTQHLGVSIAETAPYHWDGSLPTLNTLMDEVFVERMGGVFESKERLNSLGAWLSTQKHVPLEVADASAAERGKALFESREVGCADCHNGSVLSDNKAYDVGTTDDGAKLQVPALTGLVLHPPFMHNGCAKTLTERFDAACGGGDAHGKTSHLGTDQIGDLVVYLSSL